MELILGLVCPLYTMVFRCFFCFVASCRVLKDLESFLFWKKKNKTFCGNIQTEDPNIFATSIQYLKSFEHLK